MKQREKSLFDEEFRLSALSDKGDYLEKLNKAVDWESFRKPIEQAMRKPSREDGKGRPPNDAVLMFKTLVLRELYQLSDDVMEYQILDRLSFQRFLGLSLCDDAPDAKSIWHYREVLTQKKTMEKLFDRFNAILEEKGLIAEHGVIVDASFKEVPIQRNSKEENEAIKEGKKVEGWNDSKRSQKDVEARWTKKNKKSYFGYKNHIKMDAKSKLIKKYSVSSAEVHDSQEFEDLLDEKDEGQTVWADSAYRSEEAEKMIKNKKMKSQVHYRAYRNKPLSEEEKAENKRRSKTRVRVEHVFGFMKTSMKSDKLRAIGQDRIEGIIGLMNLGYNMCRYVYLSRSAG